MNLVRPALASVASLRAVADRSAWDRRRCPRCGEALTGKGGGYTRRPRFLDGRRAVRVQRHSCDLCRRTYSGRDALPVAGSGYARAVRRLAVDHRQHFGGSVRRAAERLRSLLGRQERRLIRRPPDGPPTPEAECRPSAATVERWLDRAGAAAEATVEGQPAGVATSGQVATDGLWARRRDGKAEVLLGLADSATGLLWPPAVAEGEGEAAHRQALCDRAERAGLALDSLRGVVGDGAQGLSGYPGRALDWVNRQRCVFHLWRNLAGELRARANAAATGLRRSPKGKSRPMVASRSTAMHSPLCRRMPAPFWITLIRQMENRR